MGSVCCKEDPVDLLSEVELSHFELLRSVGRGSFGKVRVVQHKGTKKLFALKYINKDKCLQSKSIDNILSERRLLEQIDYSLIVNLRYAFQDDENLFMVLDLMLGGDLRFYLDRLGVLPERYVQFYAAQVASSLNYLHRKNVIHRDLKPDNILLDERGHAHLTDFNIAVQIRPKQNKPLTSIAGSLAYISPEIFKKQGYTYSVDWWSLGVTIYELLYGQRPFRGKTNEEIQMAIVSSQIEFPNEPRLSPEAVSFMKELLTRDVTKRIGVGESGFKRLKRHPWFKNICWDILSSKAIGAPFIPDGKKSNFDPTHEFEEAFMEDHPLKVRKRMGGKNSTSDDDYYRHHYQFATMAELDNRRLLEDNFVLFDYTKLPEGIPEKIKSESKRDSNRTTKSAISRDSRKKEVRDSFDENIPMLQNSSLQSLSFLGSVQTITDGELSIPPIAAHVTRKGAPP